VKFIIIAGLLLFSSFLMGNQLGMFVDSNRFYAPEDNNFLEINYAIPYHAVDFIQGEFGYEAEIFVDIAIKLQDKKISTDSFTNKIILREPGKIFSSEEYLDKITLTLPPYDFTVEVEFIDIHTEKSFFFNEEFSPLYSDGLVSDLELSSYSKPDTTEYLAKFHRDGTLYKVQPNKTFQKEMGYLEFYHQMQNLFEDDEGNYQLIQKIIIKSEDALIDSFYHDLTGNFNDIITIQGKINIANYEEGFYSLIIKYRDKITSTHDEIVDYFCINKQSSETIRLFADLEEDLKLAAYFMNSNEKKELDNLSEEGKSNFINKFWNSKDPNPATKENEFLSQVKERILYANQMFSHFKPGWTTDMGRIFIKFGNPYEKRKLTTNLGEHEYSESSDYSYDERASAYYFNKYTVKNYEIWKYRMNRNANYIFIDLMTSGDYKLIYSSDDNDGENSLTDWKRYLGYDFDERLLE
jgi:GWxTD domain-containing protein